MERVQASALALAGRADPLRLGILGVVAIAFFGFMGALWGIEIHVPGFDLGGELNFPTFFSGGLLVAAACLTFLLSAQEGEGTRTLRFMAGFFAFMSLDEIMTIHETLEAATGIDWQILYLPVVAVGGIAFLLILRRMLAVPPSAGVWVGGAVSWFAAQVFEKLEWSGTPHGHGWMILPEETLEMFGSMLFGIAVLLVLQSRLTSPRRNLR